MNMADMRGGVSGTARNADGTAVAGVVVTAIGDSVTGRRLHHPLGDVHQTLRDDGQCEPDQRDEKGESHCSQVLPPATAKNGHLRR